MRARAWQAAIAAWRRYGPGAAPSFVGALEGGESAVDEELVPVRAVLIEQEDGLAGGADAGAGAGGLDLHEGDEAVDLGFAGSEFGEDAAEAQRVFAERGRIQSSPAVAE